MNYTELLKVLNEQFTVTKTLPDILKVNQNWFQLQQFATWTLKGSEDTFNGIPIEFDNSIETFQFVYKNNTK